MSDETNNGNEMNTPKLESLLELENDSDNQLDEFLDKFKRWLFGRQQKSQTVQRVSAVVGSLLLQIDSQQRIVRNINPNGADVSAERQQILSHLAEIKKALRSIEAKTK